MAALLSYQYINSGITQAWNAAGRQKYHFLPLPVHAGAYNAKKPDHHGRQHNSHGRYQTGRQCQYRQQTSFCLSTKQQIEDLNAGKAIFVEGMERKDGELFSSYVKLDEATGRPSYTRYNPDSPEGAREIYIPMEINGVKITAEEQQQLREGKAIFLNDMVNRKGEEFSSFIKADLETGRLSYSRTPDGFEQRAEFKIPEKVWDVKLTRNQRADLQSGKAVLVEGIKGYDGKTISQYVKANFNQGRLDFYNENPDRKRDASQRNVVANAQKQGQEQAGRKSKGASIA